MPIFNNILAGSSGQGDTGYDIDQSLRFDDGYLRKSFSSGTNPDKVTISCWVKPANLGATATTLFYGYTDASNYEKVVWNATGSLYWNRRVSGSVSFEAYTSMVFRDPSSWYHLVLVYDSTDVTTSSRIKFYVNGVLQTKSVDSPTPPTNLDSLLLSASCTVGEDQISSNPFKSYMAECHAIDGQALTPASFGETNSATNQWVPIEVTGMTYGTNGFYQKYSSTELANSFTDDPPSRNQTYTVPAGKTSIEVLVVAGGGGGGRAGGGGGGAGGIVHHSSLSVTPGEEITLTAGEGGEGGDSSDTNGHNGVNSTFGSITAIGGAGGRGWSQGNGTSGGSGSGAGAEGASRTGGSATQGNSGGGTGYGNNGGNNYSSNPYTAGGGGGAGAVGSNGSSSSAGNGGAGQLFSNFTAYGVSGYFGGGGGGGTHSSGSPSAGSGGSGGGGNGSSSASSAGANGTVNTGSGGGGGHLGSADTNGGLAGSGTVIVYDGTTYTQFTTNGGRDAHTITANGDVTNTRAQYKVGSSSIKFDGTGDYLTVPDSSDWAFGTDNFTVEFWLNHQSVATGNSAITFSPSTDKRQLLGYVDAGDGLFKLYLTSDGSNWDIASGVSMGTATLDSWKHYAIVRSGTSFYTFQDGTQISTFTSSASMYDSSDALSIGRYAGGNELNGYMDEIRISNSARYTSAFTPSTTAFTADANTLLLIHSEWNGGLGADSSGNKNDFTPTNLVATDQVLDSPTNNYCTLNPLVAPATTGSIFSEGNLKYRTYKTGGDNVQGEGTIGFTSGKWYWEIYLIGFEGSTARRGGIGVGDSVGNGTWTTDCTEAAILTVGDLNPQSHNTTFSSAGDSWSVGAAGDLWCCAFDADAGTFIITKNTAITGSETTGKWTGFATSTIGYRPITVEQSASDYTEFVYNFGQDSSFAGNKTAQGNGGDGEDFYYTPPTGYKALNTSNLDDPAIALPGDYFNTLLYTSNNSTLSVTGAGFQPDFIWFKNRTNANRHALFDSVRGATKRIASDKNEAEAADPDTLISFDSDGWSIGADTGQYGVNYTAGSSFVSWNWKAGGTASSNGDGSITSSVSANPTAGFSIVSYTGTGANATVGHGLSQTPELIIFKNLPDVESWIVYSEPVGNGGGLFLDHTNGTDADGLYFNSTSPTSSVFTVGSQNRSNGSSNAMIAYAFHSIESYSKVGSYTGNANADGPFIYTGFRPAFFLWKNTTGYSWGMTDNKRAGYNPKDYQLYANASEAEATSYHMVDFLSNGVKITSTDGTSNGSGNEIIFMAFAESPFKTSNAR